MKPLNFILGFVIASILLAGGWATAASVQRCPPQQTTTVYKTTTYTTTITTTGLPPPAISQSPLSLFRIGGGEPYGDLTKYKYIFLHNNDVPNIASIRAANPGIKVLMYKEGPGVVDPQANGQDWYPSPDGVQYNYMQANPTLWLHDSLGAKISSPGFPNIKWADVGSSQYQQKWLNNVVAYIKSVNADGVIMDDINFGSNQVLVQQNGTFSVEYPSYSSWNTAMRSFLSYVGAGLKNAGLLAFANVGAEADQPIADYADWASLLDGVCQENWLRWGTTSFFDSNGWGIWTDREKAVIAEGKIHIGFTTVVDTTETATMQYARFSHAMFEEPGLGSFTINIPNADPADPSWQINLGSPLAPATFDGTNWNRKFENGTIHVNPVTRASSIT